MKRVILLFAIALGIGIIAEAQIQNTFFGLTINTTTLEEAKPVLADLGFEQNPYSDNEYEIFGLESDGFDWDMVLLKFYETFESPNEPVLQEVMFIRIDYIPVVEKEDGDVAYVDGDNALTRIAQIDAFGREVKIFLANKYSQYIDEDTDGLTSYNDKTTEVLFYIGATAGGPGFMPYATQLTYGVNY